MTPAVYFGCSPLPTLESRRVHHPVRPVPAARFDAAAHARAHDVLDAHGSVVDAVKAAAILRAAEAPHLVAPRTHTLQVGKIHEDLAFALRRLPCGYRVILAWDGQTESTDFHGPHALRVANGFIARLKRGEERRPC